MAIAGRDPKNLRRLEAAYGRLLAEQNAKALVVDYSAYADDPEGFIIEVLGDTRIWAKPKAMIESVRVNVQTAVKGAVAVGKGHTAAEIALWWMFAKRGYVIVTGTTQDQVFRNFFDHELGRLWYPLRDKLGGRLFKRALVPYDMSAKDIGNERMGIVGVVSKDISNMAGTHGALILCIIDEAQGVGDHTWNALINNATGEHDRFLAIGNPTPPVPGEDTFYQAFRDGSGWHCITITMREHPNLIEGRTVIPGGPTLQGLERLRKKYGENTAEYNAYVNAEFSTTRADSLFQDRDIDAAELAFRNEAFRARYAGNRLVVSFDVSAGGGDRCGVTVLRGNFVEQNYRFETSGIIDTETKIVAILKELGVARRPGFGAEKWGEYDPTAAAVEATIIIDAAPTGGGPGIIAHLENDHGYDVVRFLGARTQGVPQDEDNRYENLRAFAYWALHMAFLKGEIAIPQNELLREELRAITYEFNKSDGVKITRKPVIHKAIHRSPDQADSLMMAWSVERDESGNVGASNPKESYGF